MCVGAREMRLVLQALAVCRIEGLRVVEEGGGERILGT